MTENEEVLCHILNEDGETLCGQSEKEGDLLWGIYSQEEALRREIEGTVKSACFSCSKPRCQECVRVWESERVRDKIRAAR